MASKISLWRKYMKQQLQTGGDLWDELFFVFLTAITENLYNAELFQILNALSYLLLL